MGYLGANLSGPYNTGWGVVRSRPMLLQLVPPPSWARSASVYLAPTPSWLSPPLTQASTNIPPQGRIWQCWVNTHYYAGNVGSQVVPKLLYIPYVTLRNQHNAPELAKVSVRVVLLDVPIAFRCIYPQTHLFRIGIQITRVHLKN